MRRMCLDHDESGDLTNTTSAFADSRRGLPGMFETTRLQSTPKTKAVRFGSVVIHTYAPAIGHNPSVSSGVPITLSERPLRSQQLDLHDYERQRKGKRRPARQLLINKGKREEMLLAEGFAKCEIVHAIRSARNVRINRKQTNDSRAIADVVEGAGRKLKRMMVGGSSGQAPAALKLDAGTFSHLSSTRSSQPLPVENPKPLVRKPSYDCLPKMPMRAPFDDRSREGNDSDSPSSSHSGNLACTLKNMRNTTSLWGALAHNPRETLRSRSISYEAPRIPARNTSDQDEILAGSVVQALDAAGELQKEEESFLYSSYHGNHPSRLSFSSASDDILLQEDTFWHHYSDEQAPQRPCRG